MTEFMWRCWAIWAAFLGYATLTRGLHPTAPVQLRLNLRQLPFRTNISSVIANPSLLANTSAGRTKHALFSRVLGFSRSESYVFPLAKWAELQQSGLFYNLSAHASVVNGSLSMTISGIELPAITFSPEVSLSPSIHDPEISGGLMYRNRNFRGLGELLELNVNHRESTDTEIRKLPASFLCRWSDCSIGRHSRISFSFERNGVRDLVNSFLPAVLTSERLENIGSPARESFECSKATGSFQTRWGGNGVLGIQSYVNLFNPIRSSSPTCSSALQSGAKVSWDISTQENDRLCVWHDGGYLHSKNGQYGRYCQLGATVETQPLSYRFRNLLGHSRQLIGKVRLTGVSARGSGCIPREQFQTLAGTSALRGLPTSHDTQRFHAPSMLLAKMDTYIDVSPSSSSKLGIFCDAAGWKEATSHTRSSAATWGVSLRTNGLRVDVGLPVGCLHLPRVHFGLDMGD